MNVDCIYKVRLFRVRIPTARSFSGKPFRDVVNISHNAYYQSRPCWHLREIAWPEIKLRLILWWCAVVNLTYYWIYLRYTNCIKWIKAPRRSVISNSVTVPIFPFLFFAKTSKYQHMNIISHLLSIWFANIEANQHCDVGFYEKNFCRCVCIHIWVFVVDNLRWAWNIRME